MRGPNRAINSIRPLPSIYTVFPVHYDSSLSSRTSDLHSSSRLLPSIEDGIEVVPFERCRASSWPILSPVRDEKEVLFESVSHNTNPEKPLPNLPENRWYQLSLRRRILVLLFAQFVILLTIGLGLMSARRPSQSSTEENEVRAAGDNSTSNMTRIERGTFEMPIRFPQVQSSACLARMNESVAWQCASDTTFQLDLIRTPIGDNSNATFISIGVESINKSIYHGHQVPNIASVPLSPSSSAESGPYYHFRTSYDRVVVLREDDLTAAERPRPQPSTRHPIFNPGDSLWRCIFNDTTIEGYLYINQTSTPEVETTINSTAPDLPKVPYVVKLLEEDMPTAKSHYCEKGTIERDGRFLVKGGKISLSLTDTVRASETRRARGFRWARLRKKQQSEGQNYCRCQWMVQ